MIVFYALCLLIHLWAFYVTINDERNSKGFNVTLTCFTMIFASHNTLQILEQLNN